MIKSSTSANALNDFIIQKYGQSAVDLNDPASWKYYRNISGEYHPLDTLMTVTSLDTLEEITFSKENLELHAATKRAYQFGTRYYYSLLNRYSEQEQLILGILNPCDKVKAIESEDGTILTYPVGLVEPQEITLIRDLEDYIKKYLFRWNVSSFAVSDSLYNMAQHATLYLNIYPKLLNLRLKRCKTNEVHSFHIQQYLASHQRLDRYLPYMTLKQALYFYRNICYLERNPGRVETLEELIQKILTDRRIPIAEYSVRQTVDFDETYRPAITARRRPLNTEYNISEKDYVNLDDLYDKERRLVYGNAPYYAANSVRDTRTFQNSSSSVIQTKDMESNMVDYNDALPDPLPNVLMRQWIYLASQGLYDVVINFKDPKNGETISLYAKDALIYYYYIYLKTLGLEFTVLPPIFCLKFRRHPLPSLSEVLSVVDDEFPVAKQVLQATLERQPQTVNCVSTQMFYDLSYQMYEECKQQWYQIASTGDLYERALVHNGILKLYSDTLIDLDVLNIDLWLNSKNLPQYDYDVKQAQEILLNIFVQATGYDVDDKKQLKNIQRMMLELLGQLSSYSIQLIREINDSNIVPINWAAIRPGNFDNNTRSLYHVPSTIHVNDVQGSSDSDAEIEIDHVNIDMERIIFKSDHEISVMPSVFAGIVEQRQFEIPVNSFVMNVTYPGYDEQISLNATYAGTEYFMALTEQQKRQLKSIYN